MRLTLTSPSSTFSFVYTVRKTLPPVHRASCLCCPLSSDLWWWIAYGWSPPSNGPLGPAEEKTFLVIYLWIYGFANIRLRTPRLHVILYWSIKGVAARAQIVQSDRHCFHLSYCIKPRVTCHTKFNDTVYKDAMLYFRFTPVRVASRMLTHLVLFPQLLHVSLLAADLPLPLSAVLLGSV